MAHHYALGNSDDEIQRLEQQHGTWRFATDAVLAAAGFCAGDRVADLGAGPGFTTDELAGRVGATGAVTAVDNDERFCDLIRSQAAENVTVICADTATHRFPGGSFDGMFARWLFAHMEDLTPVLETIAEALKPGGILAVMDYLQYRSVALMPDAHAFQSAYEKLFRIAHQRRLGFLDVIGRLPRKLRPFGLETVWIKAFSLAGGPGSDVWEWMSRFHRQLLPMLIEQEFLTNQEVQAVQEEWERMTADPTSILVSQTVGGLVARKVTT
ncbi:class I SAM-dependent methyltransferase [Desulfoferrobacter suflitae]|uniref:class I SAM-dependent methyltransferase n=1 Tax=Desulfoferrobacter suflitae TaxID=2865782 RepID=UPI002164C67B|nr:class I SAM-dependent methyltransferase [Desulfoferrobacter suflitae]MCK8602580.1 class I SAM-dependent methyltransferase [Desulfoferrobacter suflitae]